MGKETGISYGTEPEDTVGFKHRPRSTQKKDKPVTGKGSGHFGKGM